MDEVYELCLVGELAFPAGGLEAWRALRLDPRTYDDWPEAFRTTGADGDGVVTIGTWLDDGVRYERGARLFIDVEASDARLAFRARLDEPDYDRYKRQLVTLFRLAAKAGGTGELTIASRPGDKVGIGYRVEVTPDGSRIEKLTSEEIAHAASRPTMQEILDRPVTPPVTLLTQASS